MSKEIYSFSPFVLSSPFRGREINQAEDVRAGIVYGVTGDSNGIQHNDKNQVIEGLTIDYNV